MIRHDYISRTYILMIKELDLNENPRWIEFKEYIKYNKIIITLNIIKNLHKNSIN